LKRLLLIASQKQFFFSRKSNVKSEAKTSKQKLVKIRAIRGKKENLKSAVKTKKSCQQKK